jgi:hypothetical protein
MVQQNLVEYIRRLLEQGYDSGTIRTTLLNAGYSPYDVDAALRAAGGAPARKIGLRPLLIAFVIILFASAGALLLLKLLQAPPVELDVSMNLFSTQIALGQEVVANIDIRNPSGREVGGLIDFEVSGPAGRVAAKTEKFSVVNQASVPVSIQLPASAVIGDYSVLVTVSYKGKSERVSSGFSVVERVERPVVPVETLEREAEETARELQLTCPGGCDDLNFCTNDACVQGVCRNEQIVPCCGNGRCESGESQSSCMLDCSERPVSPEEISVKAEELAKSDVGRAVEVCGSLVQRSYVDGCLSKVAEASGNKAPCSQVVNSDVRDGCFVAFAYKNDFSVCAEIKNSYMTWAQISASKPPS